MTLPVPYDQSKEKIRYRIADTLRQPLRYRDIVGFRGRLRLECLPEPVWLKWRAFRRQELP